MARARGGRVVTQDALVEGVHFRLDWTSWRDLGFQRRRRQPERPRRRRRRAGGARRHARACRRTRRWRTSLELYEGIGEPGVPIVGGDTTRRRGVMLGVTALGRSERVPGRSGARAGDALVVTGPLGARRGCTPSGEGIDSRS